MNVFLLDPMELTKVQTVRVDIQKKLQGFFDQVVRVANQQTPGQPQTAQVQFSDKKPTPTDTDLVIYFVPPDISIVSVFDKKPRDPIGTSHWGFTQIKTKTQNGQTEVEAASEVMTKSLDSGTLAALAFHEAMHHKLVLGNDLHNRDGLARATVDGNTNPSDRNKADMARALTRRIKQWTDGFDKLVDAKRRKDGGDLFWYQIS